MHNVVYFFFFYVNPGRNCTARVHASSLAPHKTYSWCGVSLGTHHGLPLKEGHSALTHCSYLLPR